MSQHQRLIVGGLKKGKAVEAHVSEKVHPFFARLPGIRRCAAVYHPTLPYQLDPDSSSEFEILQRFAITNHYCAMHRRTKTSGSTEPLHKPSAKRPHTP